MESLETSLCVVGCGPTGVAALFEAACLGIDAIGIEAGSLPLAAIHAHMPGLTYLSPASHFEVAGVPLDCRDAEQCTREDVLFYYARLIQYAGLTLRCGARCHAIRRERGAVYVGAMGDRGELRIRARDVLLTAWSVPGALGADEVEAGTEVEIRSSLGHPIEHAGKRVVVIGGGVSGYEQAGALMKLGCRVALLLRGERRTVLHEEPRFVALLAATGSQILERARALRVRQRSIAFDVAGVPHELACDLLVVAEGTRIDPAMLELARRTGALSAAEAEALRTTSSLERLLRKHPNAEFADIERLAVETRPDLHRQLFDGVDHVRLAGAILHLGATDAGVVMSIATAALAVRAIAGEAPPPELAPPLTRALLGFGREQRARVLGYDPRLVDALHPLAIDGWSRAALRTSRRQALGHGPGDAAATGGIDYALPGSGPPWTREERELLALCDGQRSLGRIADERGLARAELRATLRRLWISNALTWLPPAQGLPRFTHNERT